MPLPIKSQTPKPIGAKKTKPNPNSLFEKLEMKYDVPDRNHIKESFAVMKQEIPTDQQFNSAPTVFQMPTLKFHDLVMTLFTFYPPTNRLSLPDIFVFPTFTCSDLVHGSFRQVFHFYGKLKSKVGKVIFEVQFDTTTGSQLDLFCLWIRYTFPNLLVRVNFYTRMLSVIQMTSLEFSNGLAFVKDRREKFYIPKHFETSEGIFQSFDLNSYSYSNRAPRSITMADFMSSMIGPNLNYGFDYIPYNVDHRIRCETFLRWRGRKYWFLIWKIGDRNKGFFDEKNRVWWGREFYKVIELSTSQSSNDAPNPLLKHIAQYIA